MKYELKEKALEANVSKAFSFIYVNANYSYFIPYILYFS